MSTRQHLEALLLEHLPFVDRVCATLARRFGIRGLDAEDFAAWARLRLVEDDYEVLDRFRGDSTLRTYLVSVLTQAAHDYRVRERGRWRPSAAALRQGPMAVQLERLLHRDGCSFEEAMERLRASGEEGSSERELRVLFRRLPRRAPLRPRIVDPEILDTTPGAGDAEERVREAEAEAEHGLVRQALARALDGLSDEDRVLVRMRFWEGSSVADIARALDVAQKPLYRKLDRLLVVLRRELEDSGVGAQAVGVLVGEALAVPAIVRGRAPPAPANGDDGSSHVLPGSLAPPPHPPTLSNVLDLSPPPDQ